MSQNRLLLNILLIITDLGKSDKKFIYFCWTAVTLINSNWFSNFVADASAAGAWMTRRKIWSEKLGNMIYVKNKQEFAVVIY